MTARALAAAAALALAAAGCNKVRHVPEEPPKKPEAPEQKAEKGVPPHGNVPREPASPEALLAPGALGRIQEALTTRGLLPAEHRRGDLDAATKAALRKFQDGEGLAATGFPDRETLQRLGMDPQDAYGRPGDAPAQGK